MGLLPRTLIAAPSEVVTRFVAMVSDGTLGHHCLVSLRRLILGFGIGISLGVAFGALVGTDRLFSRLLEPTILTLIPVPPIAWIPLLIIFFGIGETSKVLLIAVGSFCTLFIHTAYAVRSTDSHLVELAHVLGKPSREIAVRVLLPSSVPAILAASRVALALSWTLLICAEVIASSSGLGWLIWDARNFSRPDDMLVGMVTVAGLGKATDAGLELLERRLTVWRRSYRDLVHV